MLKVKLTFRSLIVFSTLLQHGSRGIGLLVTSQPDYTDNKKHHVVTLIQLRTPCSSNIPHLQAQPADTYTETPTDSLGLSF